MSADSFDPKRLFDTPTTSSTSTLPDPRSAQAADADAELLQRVPGEWVGRRLLRMGRRQQVFAALVAIGMVVPRLGDLAIEDAALADAILASRFANRWLTGQLAAAHENGPMWEMARRESLRRLERDGLSAGDVPTLVTARVLDACFRAARAAADATRTGRQSTYAVVHAAVADTVAQTGAGTVDADRRSNFLRRWWIRLQERLAVADASTAELRWGG